MRRLLVSSTILALACAAGAAPGPSGFAAQGAPVLSRPTPTHFALQAVGYGSRARGGSIPTSSDDTAYQIISCTNRAGLDRGNHVLEATLPGAGTASDVTTSVWTRARHGVVSSYSRNTISRIVLADSPLGSLSINGVLSLSRAYHDADGFHGTNRTSIASISFTPPGGAPQSLDLPTPGQPVEVPGVATLSVGDAAKSVTRDGARVNTDALQIYSVATGTRTRIGHTSAGIQRGITTGLFNGSSSGTRISSLDGNLTSGRSPLLVMPCRGTNGAVRTKSGSDSTLEGGLFAQGLSTAHSADQDRRRAHGYESARIQSVNLGDGQLIAKGIVGRVNVSRSADGTLHRTINGTTIGTVTANGQRQAFPDTDVLEIPGVAKLERNVVKKVKDGLQVISLRITVLDGTGAVFNLGEARLRIRPSGN